MTSRVPFAAALIAAVVAASSVAADDAARSAFQQELTKLIGAVDAARSRSEAAEAAYSQMRSRGRLRGEKKAAIIAEVDEAAEAVKTAEAELEAFREHARRSGVPPGWQRLPEREANPANAP